MDLPKAEHDRRELRTCDGCCACCRLDREGSPDGACEHIKDNRCAIYEQRPDECREFDCPNTSTSSVIAIGMVHGLIFLNRLDS